MCWMARVEILDELESVSLLHFLHPVIKNCDSLNFPLQ